jgi:hypothetical protein
MRGLLELVVDTVTLLIRDRLQGKAAAMNSMIASAVIEKMARPDKASSSEVAYLLLREPVEWVEQL